MNPFTISRIGNTALDEDHAELSHLIALAEDCGDADMRDHLDTLIEHLRAHFTQEDQLMRGTDFPPKDCHIREHAAVLSSAAQVRERVCIGQHRVGRAFIAELANWLPAHVDHLDSALSAWISKQRHGGKPIVLQGIRNTHCASRQAA